ncbi:MAG TPA: Uma2 family endonuclease [Nodosilinea sp.]|nr:Uma2 family endonuclease [Nodosilinea sp.]
MTVTTTRMGLEDFFAYTSDRDTLYELEDGELFEMPLESDLNQRIASFLFAYFLRQGIDPDRLRTKTEIAVMGVRTTVRVPDLLVLSEELATALEGATRATVTLDMPPPRLVVEVVSPGKKNINRDYRYQRSQYEARGIVEYSIVDPIAQRVSVLTRIDRPYSAAALAGQQTATTPKTAPVKATYTAER